MAGSHFCSDELFILVNLPIFGKEQAQENSSRAGYIDQTPKNCQILKE
jgi:hypothetical protein